MTKCVANALDAAGVIVRTESLAEAKWDDIKALLNELGFTTTPMVWYYTLGFYGEIIGLDAEQRSRIHADKHVFFNVYPGNPRSVKLDPVGAAEKYKTPLHEDFVHQLNLALQGSGHPVMGDVVVAKKFPAAPTAGTFYCPPLEFSPRPLENGEFRAGAAFWLAGMGTAITSPGGKSTFAPDPADDRAVLGGLWKWLEKQKFKTLLRQWVKGTSAAKPRLTKERTIEHTGTCGICFGNFKMDRGGRLVLHGYTRPGFGWLNGECFGTHYPPYEVSDEACRSFAASLDRSLAAVTKSLEEFQQKRADGTLTWLPDSRNGRPGYGRKYFPPVSPGDERWEIELRNYPRGLEERIAGIKSLMPLNAKLLKLWEPRPLPGEPGHKSIGRLLHEQRREGAVKGYAAVRYRGKLYPLRS